MEAVAGAPRLGDRREARPPADASGDLAHKLPRDRGVVGGCEPLSGRQRQLELTPAVLRQEGLERASGEPKRRCQLARKRLREPQGLQREDGRSRPVRVGEGELLLERRDERQARLGDERAERPLEQAARAGVRRSSSSAAGTARPRLRPETSLVRKTTSSSPGTLMLRILSSDAGAAGATVVEDVRR